MFNIEFSLFIKYVHTIFFPRKVNKRICENGKRINEKGETMATKCDLH